MWVICAECMFPLNAHLICTHLASLSPNEQCHRPLSLVSAAQWMILYLSEDSQAAPELPKVNSLRARNVSSQTVPNLVTVLQVIFSYFNRWGCGVWWEIETKNQGNL